MKRLIRSTSSLVSSVLLIASLVLSLVLLALAWLFPSAVEACDKVARALFGK